MGSVVATNRGCKALFGQDLVGTNMIDRYIADCADPDSGTDWYAVAWSTRARLRARLARSPHDDRLPALIARLDTMLGDRSVPAGDRADLVATPSFRIGGRLIRMGLLAAGFDAAKDITLEELRIELFYPLDPGSEEFFRLR